MNNQQSNSTQLVLTTGATGQLGPRPVCGLPRRRAMLRPPIEGRGARHLRGTPAEAVVTPVEREPIAFERFAREHKDAFGCPVSVP